MCLHILSVLQEMDGATSAVMTISPTLSLRSSSETGLVAGLEQATGDLTDSNLPVNLFKNGW